MKGSETVGHRPAREDVGDGAIADRGRADQAEAGVRIRIDEFRHIVRCGGEVVPGATRELKQRSEAMSVLARVRAATGGQVLKAIGQRIGTPEVTRVKRGEAVPQQGLRLIDDRAGRNEAFEHGPIQLDRPGDLSVQDVDLCRPLRWVRKSRGVRRLDEPGGLIRAGQVVGERGTLDEQASERYVIAGLPPFRSPSPSSRRTSASSGTRWK